MNWRLAKSIEVLRRQVNEAYPNRRKSSDGTIGDANHATRNSDHNPWVTDGDVGVVTAIDFTHDPSSGMDAGKLAQALVDSRDKRIKYVIWNRQICAGVNGPNPWKWRKYNGSNPHNKHMHLSVLASKIDYDNQATWLVKFPEAKPKSIVKSKIVQGSATVGTIEAGDAFNTAIDVANKVADAKGAAENVGMWDYVSHLFTNPRFLIAVAVIVIVIAIIYWRWRDHQ